MIVCKCLCGRVGGCGCYVCACACSHRFLQHISFLTCCFLVCGFCLFVSLLIISSISYLCDVWCFAVFLLLLNEFPAGTIALYFWKRNGVLQSCSLSQRAERATQTMEYGEFADWRWVSAPGFRNCSALRLVTLKASQSRQCFIAFMRFPHTTWLADARTDVVETSTSFSISDALSFSTFRTSVESLLTQWPATVPWRHKLASQ